MGETTVLLDGLYDVFLKPETIWLVHICLAKIYALSVHCKPDSWKVSPIFVGSFICLANAHVFSVLVAAGQDSIKLILYKSGW